MLLHESTLIILYSSKIKGDDVYESSIIISMLGISLFYVIVMKFSKPGKAVAISIVLIKLILKFSIIDVAEDYHLYIFIPQIANFLFPNSSISLIYEPVAYYGLHS